MEVIFQILANFHFLQFNWSDNDNIFSIYLLYYYSGFPKEMPELKFRLRFFFRSATVCNSLINTHAQRFYWWADPDEHMAWCNGGRRRDYAVEDQHKYCGRIQDGYKMSTLKDEERFQNGLVCKPYDRSLYERTFMSEPFIEKHAISTELCNVNREKQKT